MPPSSLVPDDGDEVSVGPDDAARTTKLFGKPGEESGSESTGGAGSRRSKGKKGKVKGRTQKGKKGGLVKKKLKQGMKICRGCKKEFNADYANTSVAFCEDDNKAMGRIEAMAKAAGKDTLRWMSDIRKDDAKVFKLLKNYWDSVGGRTKWTSKTPRGVKWSLTEYKQSVQVCERVSLNLLACLTELWCAAAQSVSEVIPYTAVPTRSRADDKV
jgi:hypothetical protein